MPEAEATPKRLRSFTVKELEQFNGKSGNPLYIAFKGRVYDLSKSRLWVNGTHLGVHTYNENLSETIKSAPHGEETLARYPIIGEISEEIVKTLTPSEKVEKGAVEQPSEQPQLMDRRVFLKLAAAAGGAVTIAAVASSLKLLTFIPSSSVQLSWPRLKITNLNSLVLLTPISFNYPLTNTPNLLVKLGVKAQNGVGPDGDIVAYSNICQHLGCYYSFLKPGTSPSCNPSFSASIPQAYCCCHGSQYDFVNGAKVIGGPAPRPLPPVTLEYDSTTGDIYAVAMGPPTIYGHGPPGTTDPALVMQYDLQGGNLVGT